MWTRERVASGAEISYVTDPETGDITAYFANRSWGPVVTDKTMEVVQAKMEQAMLVTAIGNSFVDAICFEAN